MRDYVIFFVLSIYKHKYLTMVETISAWFDETENVLLDDFYSDQYKNEGE